MNSYSTQSHKSSAISDQTQTSKWLSRLQKNRSAV